jgi:predicted ATPase
VIFLDDLQWSDSASLNLLELLMHESGKLLILGAYRDNEVSPVHPLMIAVNQIGETGATVNQITLEPLSPRDINLLVADTLNCDFDLAQPLTELLVQKTHGNPFFTTQLLKVLHREGFIQFNLDVGYWQFDLNQIKMQSLTVDVVEFMAQQLQNLPHETQQVLQLAACIGAEFDLQTLGVVFEQSAAETAKALWRALEEGFILPLNENYKFCQADIKDGLCTETIAIHYKFLHDRVQQAAYSLIPAQQRSVVHYRIGKLLLQQLSPQTKEEQIFNVVNQLNNGIGLIVDQSERDEIAELNLLAGNKAKASAAYQAAGKYAEMGLNLLGGGIISRP